MMQSMNDTALINFSSNMGGTAINIEHGDYSIVPARSWYTERGEVIVETYDECIATGLMVWK